MATRSLRPPKGKTTENVFVKRPLRFGGHGIFASKSIQPHEYVTYYEGKMISRREALALRAAKKGDWLKSISPQQQVIDGVRIDGDITTGIRFAGKASLANHSYKEWNAVFVEESGVVYLKATAAGIPKGAEILVNYGKTFWKYKKETPV